VKQVPAPAASEARPEPVSLPQIFALFAQIGLTSFGGGLSAWIFQQVVVRRGWMREDEFLAGLTVAQVLPGPNVINLAIYVGQRLRGIGGSVVAFLGLLSGPFVAVIALASAYSVVSRWPYADLAMEGVAATAIGLLLTVALRGVRRASRSVAGTPALVATFIGVVCD
jgi:chromate transporter